MVGGFSRSFDLIQAEYGWEDEKVLDLTLARFRQIIANIEERLWAIRERTLQQVEWQTKTLAIFIAASVPTPKGKQNPLLAEAQKIRLRMTDGAETYSEAALPEVYVEEGSQTAKNAPGSTEALLAGFR